MVTFSIPVSVPVSGEVLGTFEKWFYNALRALQVNQAKEDYPRCSLHVRVSHILESTVKDIRTVLLGCIPGRGLFEVAIFLLLS